MNRTKTEKLVESKVCVFRLSISSLEKVARAIATALPIYILLGGAPA